MSNEFMKFISLDEQRGQQSDQRRDMPAPLRVRETPGHTDADFVQRVLKEEGTNVAYRLQETREAAVRVNRRVLAALDVA